MRRMRNAIAAAERLQQSQEISDEEREELSQSLQAVRAALDRYRAARFKKGTRAGTLGMMGAAAAAIVADDATVIGVADDPLLIPLALGAIAMVIRSHAPSVRDELSSAWLELGQRIEALSHTVSMTSRGNVIHQHLVDEARQRAIRRAAASGTTLSESQVTEAMLCDELERMTKELRRAGNTEDWKKAISTQKGLRCRPSRNSRE
jgi:hypothetical protein